MDHPWNSCFPLLELPQFQDWFSGLPNDFLSFKSAKVSSCYLQPKNSDRLSLQVEFLAMFNDYLQQQPVPCANTRYDAKAFTGLEPSWENYCTKGLHFPSTKLESQRTTHYKRNLSHGFLYLQTSYIYFSVSIFCYKSYTEGQESKNKINHNHILGQFNVFTCSCHLLILVYVQNTFLSSTTLS